jgi:polyisoprenoid-binding protein YceI
MMSMFISDESLRAMYPGGRADATARRMSRCWASVFRLGLLPVVRAVRPDHPAHGAVRPDRAAPRKRHWWRWILAGLGVLVVLAVLATGLFVKLQTAAPPLALPAGRASAPAGPLSGTWTVAAGSRAGFRVRESAMGFSNDVVGRTGEVTGTLVISGDRVTTATFRIRLTAVTVNGKPQPQFARSLGTQRDPVATFTLTRPVPLGTAFTGGSAVSVTAAGQLAMDQISRPVTVTLAGRRDGSALQAAGSIPVTLSRWDIRGPQGLGFLGSLARNGTAEFLLILRHGGASAAAG